ncbi:MAG: cation diffusion facilitator family transporter [Rhizonema sp. PD37]|nr:cation diffusion facilitator family transporter [Rhizonema sp. PD37]
MALMQGHTGIDSTVGCNCCYLNQTEVIQTREKTQTLWMTIGLLGGFFVMELSIGLWSHSLSLLADAEHLFSDVGALGLTLLATYFARKPAADRATFGYRRVEILAALVNGLSLLAIAILITCEAIGRFQAPVAVLGLPMLITSVIGLCVNILNITLLHQHSHDDLNLRGAFLHVVADTISSLGVILAAIAIYYLNCLWIDAVASLIVAILTGLSAIPLIWESVRILMEYAPNSINPTVVAASLKTFPQVESIEKLHIWTITAGQVMLCAHVKVKSPTVAEQERLLKQLQSHLNQEFGIPESILQLTNCHDRESVIRHPLNQDLVSLLSSRYKAD